MSLIKRVLGSLEARLNAPRLSLWRTVYTNFRVLPFIQAIKFPIYIYGKLGLWGLQGKVILLDTPIRRGMIQIGVNVDSFTRFDYSGFIQLACNRARLIFHGPCRISQNSKIRVTDGELHFGRYAVIGSGSKVICNGKHIWFGDYSRTAFEVCIINSGFHSVYSEVKGGFKNKTSDIYIGNKVWLANRATITGGAYIPDSTIVCSGSLVNKNYSSANQETQMLAGCPAKVVATGVRRVFSPRYENEISEWFVKHPNETFYSVANFEDHCEEIKVEF